MAAYYRATLTEFLKDDPKRILGFLISGSGESGFADHKNLQTKAWQHEIEILKATCSYLVEKDAAKSAWTLLLEYPIPRRRGRIDAVILARSLIFCIEFKTEEKKHGRQIERQVEDYALDLRDFHEQSAGRRIIPFAVVPKGKGQSPPEAPDYFANAVRPVWKANAEDLATMLLAACDIEDAKAESPIEGQSWDLSPYRPVPTIIEAAQALYAGHDVREIAHSHAGAGNLTVTSEKLAEIIQRANRNREKVACFVTGIPGAGKTLVGLNVVHSPVLRQKDSAVFLSGNGPLVKIVSAAIARQRDDGTRTISTFVQNVHQFTREYIEKKDRPPAEHIVIFDEAQRAWDAEQNQKKTAQEMSEPETMLAILDRHPDWAVLIALVGGGQEIHDGEAGLAQWGASLREKFPHWRIAVSPNALAGDASNSSQRLFNDGNSGSLSIEREPSLHLNVCLRSFRAQQTSEWVDAVLNGESKKAAQIIGKVQKFPIFLTRSLNSARSWLRSQTRGFRRSGLLASSGAVRLRPEGLELSSGFRQGNRDLYVHWFLDQPPDIRSSNQLEVAASEFECQGLELDQVGVCWGGDFTFDRDNRGWEFRNFRGGQWQGIRNDADRRYLLNTYRVLLTRAREGLIIWVPQGDSSDSTRPPDWFDSTADYLKACGLTIL